jgi:hypothetical protein
MPRGLHHHLEVPLNIAATSLRRKGLLIALAAMLVAGASLLLLIGGSKPAGADQNANNTDCQGHVEKGEPSPDDPTATQVKYVFACSGPITGYQIQPQVPAQSLDTEVFALDRTTKQVVPTDSFSCQGIIPSYGINCVGTYGGNYEVVNGQFSIDPKLCDEPRVDPLLTVVYATKNASGAVVQAIAGPFDLGRPRGCPKSAQNGKWRIPQEKEESPL